MSPVHTHSMSAPASAKHDKLPMPAYTSAIDVPHPIPQSRALHVNDPAPHHLTSLAQYYAHLLDLFPAPTRYHDYIYHDLPRAASLPFPRRPTLDDIRTHVQLMLQDPGPHLRHTLLAHMLYDVRCHWPPHLRFPSSPSKSAYIARPNTAPIPPTQNECPHPAPPTPLTHNPETPPHAPAPPTPHAPPSSPDMQPKQPSKHAPPGQVTLKFHNTGCFREWKARLSPGVHKRIFDRAASYVGLQETGTDSAAMYSDCCAGFTVHNSPCNVTLMRTGVCGKGLAYLTPPTTTAIQDAVHVSPHFQWCTLRTQHTPEPLHVCNVHMPCINNTTTREDRQRVWDALTTSIHTHMQRGQVILGGDWNADILAGPGAPQHENTVRLCNLVSSTGLTNLTSTWHAHHIHTFQHKACTHTSRLDHILCSPSLAHHCTEYSSIPLHQLPPQWDHSPLTVTFHFSSAPPKPSKRFRWDVTRSHAFAAYLKSHHTDTLSSIRDLADANQLDKADTLFHNMMWDAAYACNMVQYTSTPTRANTARPLFQHKLNSKAKQARSYLRQLLSQTPRPSREEIHAARKVFRQELRRSSAKAAYAKSTKMLDKLRNNPKAFWKPWHGTETQGPPLIDTASWRAHWRKVFGKAAPDPPDSLPTFVDFPRNMQLPSADPSVYDTHTTLIQPATLDELHNVIKHMKHGTAAGADGIPLDAIIQANCADPDGERTEYVPLEAFIHILNAALRLARVPSRWKVSRITAIHKRGDALNCSNYRPISVTQSSYKLFTTLLNSRLTRALENHHVLHPSLYGFRKKSGSVQPVALLKHWVDSSWNDRRSTHKRVYACFADLRGAFDNVDTTILLSALSALGLPQPLVSLITDLYTGASARCFDGGTLDKVPIPLQRGIRQGCPLSPTLFNIFMSIMAEHLSAYVPKVKPKYNSLNSLFYADDTTLVAHSPSDLQCLMTMLHDLCCRLRMSIDPAKTKVMIFHGSPSHRTTDFFIGDVKIDCVQTHTYLGIPLDCTMSTSYMRRRRLAKAETMFFRAVQFANAACLNHMQQLTSLLAATLVQAALYGVELWGLMELKDMDVLDNPLQTLMAKFLRTTLKLPVHTSTVILMLESGQKPAYTYCMRRTSSFVHKCTHSADPLLKAMVTDRQFMTHWNATVLNIARCTAPSSNQPPPRMPTSRSSQHTAPSLPPPADLPAMLMPLYTKALQKYRDDKPYAQSAQHRITSTYVQEIWNQKIACTHHARHKFYDTLDIPYLQYRAWLRVRTLTLGLPAYELTTGDPSKHTCPLACPGRGDLRHWILHCAPVQLEMQNRFPNARIPPLSLRSFFSESGDMTVLSAQVYTLYSLLAKVI